MRALLGDRQSVAALVIASLLCGLAESAIVALVVQSATALVDRSTHVRVDFGPLHAHATLGALFGLAFVLALVRLALQVVISVVPARISANMQNRLRTELFAAFTRASWRLQSRDGEGYMQELMVNQVAQATVGALAATTLVVALLTFVVLILSAFVLNFVAALVVLAAAIGLFALLRPLSDRTRQRAHETSSASVALAGGVNESVRVAEETRVFGTDAAQRRRLDVLIAQVQVPYFHVQFLARLVPGIYQSLVYVLVVGALAAVYASGTNHVASLGAVVLLLVRAGTYGQAVQSSYQSARAALPFVERVDEARRRYAADSRSSGTHRLGALRALAFDRVCFAYERESPVLSDIDFEISSGEAVGIVGPSGAGKSTLVQILLRLRAPDSGRYLVNGVLAEQIDSQEWHRRVAYVPQEPRLLHASVRDNIRFFRDFDNGELERAARLAAIHDEIVSWPDGYETIVGPRADGVSGGQQQRICIARALIAEPDVLVLDEPTSALDPHSEMIIQRSLATLKGTLTLFVVAHRMSTLDMCERVMVIVDGRLEAFDTPARLEGSNRYFRSASVLAARPSTTGS